MRQATRWAAIGLLLLLAGLAGWVLGRAQERRAAAHLMESEFQRAFLAHVQHVQNAEALLAKALASSTPGQQILLLTRVRAEADAARAELARLPLGARLLESQRVLAQMGDLAYALAVSLAQGRAPSPGDWQALNRLHGAAVEMASRLGELQLRAVREGFRWSGAAGLPGAGARAAAAKGAGVDGALLQLDRDLRQIPSPVYDGAFSASNLERRPRTSPGSPVRRDEAERRARAAAGGGLRLEDTATLRGALPGWAFVFRRTAPGPQPLGGRPGDEVAVAITRDGGRLLWILANRPPGPARLGTEEAVGRARAAAAALGFPASEATGWVTQGNAVTVTLVPVEPLERLAPAATGRLRAQPVLLYPDAVKVTVALDDGSVLAVDARDYWMSRHPRRLPAPRLAAGDAEAALSPGLVAQRARLAVIRLPSGREVLAWEVLASLGADRFLVYLNAADGREEALLRLVEGQGARIAQ